MRWRSTPPTRWRRWRDEFVIPDPELIYLDGNSLGRTPKRTVAALHRVVEQWAGDLIRRGGSTTGWTSRSPSATNSPRCSAPAPGEVAVHESTTVGIFQQVNVALDLVPGRRVIAIDDDDFPTDRYVVDGIARLRGAEVRHGLDDLDGVDVVVRSLVDYRTAEVADLAGETAPGRCTGRRRCGISPTRSACSTSTCRAPASNSRSAAPTSSSTAGPVHRRSCSCPRRFRTG